ncbi:MAG: hypothetical protein ABEJ05_08385 [Haloglomus sp.]
MRRGPPNPDPARSALPVGLVVASLAVLALLVGQLLASPLVVGVLLGVGAAVSTALVAVALLRRVVAVTLDGSDSEDQRLSEADARPTD